MKKDEKFDLENRLIDETNELISIFVTSIKTAKQNMNSTS